MSATISSLTAAQAVLLIFIANVFLVIAFVFGGSLLAGRKSETSLFDTTWKELSGTVISIFFNTTFCLLFFLLYKNDVLQFKTDFNYSVALDFFILFLGLDLLYYLLHRLMHATILFPSIHTLHHSEKSSFPLYFFVRHPLEIFFGALILFTVIWIYPVNVYALLIYLLFFTFSGIIRHLNAEIFPLWWQKVPVLNLFVTSTFHLLHNQKLNVNFGCSTIWWDKLFGTLDEKYREEFVHFRRKSNGL